MVNVYTAASSRLPRSRAQLHWILDVLLVNPGIALSCVSGTNKEGYSKQVWPEYCLECTLVAGALTECR